MDWKPYADRGWYHSDGGSGRGKIEGSIWETGVVQSLADSYDKILSGTQDDPALYTFLKRQSQKYELPKPKGTRALFVANVDDGILKTAFEAVLSLQIRGNQGMRPTYGCYMCYCAEHQPSDYSMAGLVICTGWRGYSGVDAQSF